MSEHSPQVTVTVPTDRLDGTRCVILRPGDVLILVGPNLTEGLPGALDTLRSDLELRQLIVCEQLEHVQVVDLDADLAEANRQLESYGRLFEMESKTLNDTIDRMHTAERERDDLRRKLAELRTAAEQ